MSVVRDVKVKLRISAIFTEQEERGSDKPGKDGRQSHIVSDMPEIIIDRDELSRRLTDAGLVLHEGWELDNDGPPKVVTAGIQFLTKNSVTFNGTVSTHGQTTCGFLYGLTKDVNTSTVDAIQSPVGANLDDVFIRNGVAALVPGSKYYYRAWANTAGIFTRYGAVRSFTTPLV